MVSGGGVGGGWVWGEGEGGGWGWVRDGGTRKKMVLSHFSSLFVLKSYSFTYRIFQSPSLKIKAIKTQTVIVKINILFYIRSK